MRWIYGHKREFKTLEQRKLNPYEIVFTWNLLVQKDTFLKYPFDETIKDYGFEDFLFLKELKKNNIKINQIENYCIHFNSDTSSQFVQKYHSSLQNLRSLIDSKKIDYEDTGLSRLYLKTSKYGLHKFIAFCFPIFKNILFTILSSKYSNLFLFDLYKLGYFCKISRHKNVSFVQKNNS